MGVLANEIAAYKAMRKDLEARHPHEWAVFHGSRFEGVFPDFESAAESAMERFDLGPYLIRQIGVERVQLFAGMTFEPSHAHGPGGV